MKAEIIQMLIKSGDVGREVVALVVQHHRNEIVGRVLMKGTKISGFINEYA